MREKLLDGKLPAKQDCCGECQEKNKSLLHLKISKPASQYDRHRPPWIRNSLKVWPEDARRQLSRVKRDQRTGSYPPSENGWQRRSRRRPIAVPFKAPYWATASAAYSEQVGVNRQAGGRSGESVYLNILRRRITTRSIRVPTSLPRDVLSIFGQGLRQ